MPLYDYRCSACGRLVEVMHGINEPGPAACGECGGRMQKVLSPPAIHFKGSGWAKKDAASKARAATSKPAAESSPSDKTEGGKKPPADTSAGPSDSKTTSSEPKAAATTTSD